MPRNRRASKSSGKSRAWCFTLNNPTDDESAALRSLGECDICTYVVCGKEIGERGTPHVQGFVCWRNPRSMSGVKKHAGFKRAHLERMRGTHAEAAAYCKKDGDFWEAGELPRAGRRSDLDEIKNEISEGKSELFIAENHFSQWVVYRRSFTAYRRLLDNTPRDFKSFTNVLIGSTGTGKTRFVFQQHRDESIYVWSGDRWFDGYAGHAVALLDDFRGELEVGFLLRLLDRYPMQVPIKGGFVNWRPRRIYITSNRVPEFWWDDRVVDRESIDALKRRFDRVDVVNENIFE